MDIYTFKKSSILMGMGQFHDLMCEEMIFPLYKGKKWWTELQVCGNAIQLFQCSKYPFITGGIICFVENLRTNEWKIPRGNNIYFVDKFGAASVSKSYYSSVI